MAEQPDSKPGCCGFKSHWAHQFKTWKPIRQTIALRAAGVAGRLSGYVTRTGPDLEAYLAGPLVWGKRKTPI
jgi:hypothetical protein